MGLLLALILVPLIALGFNIALAMRLADDGQQSWATKIIGFFPVAGLIWSFAGGALLGKDAISQLFFHSIALAIYGAVVVSLFDVLAGGKFKGHTLWSLALTLPSILSVLVYVALV